MVTLLALGGITLCVWGVVRWVSLLDRKQSALIGIPLRPERESGGDGDRERP
ncbi:MAG: hypothetical protein NBKEAIPA_03192 [Nitrospirae bacterium]|nr:MAG: hypothetical protein UZ03_NOB001003043 [Nitrospira sp. OLB3]MBV6471260.1 hypothetical protein [Nitrospirota bacterium]MCK6491984.1 hypothetical protein [Nitrospira sp.]MEB2338882.1 hypothetical protein [Nitrospirales bacterium]MCK6499947.1 hypothetical protein [Nitrospira sp.]